MNTSLDRMINMKIEYVTFIKLFDTFNVRNLHLPMVLRWEPLFLPRRAYIPILQEDGVCQIILLAQQLRGHLSLSKGSRTQHSAQASTGVRRRPSVPGEARVHIQDTPLIVHTVPECSPSVIFTNIVWSPQCVMCQLKSVHNF